MGGVDGVSRSGYLDKTCCLDWCGGEFGVGTSWSCGGGKDVFDAEIPCVAGRLGRGGLDG